MSLLIRPVRSAATRQTCLVAVLVMLTGHSVPAQDRLLSGRQLQDALNHRRSLTLAGTPLRQAVTELQANTGIAILLDRRIDPTTTVDVKTDYVTTADVLTALAKAIPSASVSLTDHFVLIGPAAAAGRLRTLLEIQRQKIQNLKRRTDPDVFAAATQPMQVSWEFLAEPRELLIYQTSTADIKILNPELVPHDLWAKATLPRLPLTDFATLLLSQYDLTFELSEDQQLTIVPITDTVTLEQRHRVPAREKDNVIRRWKSAFPNLNITWKGSTAVVSATVETHERLKQLIREKPNTVVAAAAIRDRRFTMKAPAGTAIGTLIVTLRQSGVPVRIEGKTDTELAPLLRQTVQFDLTDSPAAEFFPEIFRDWGANVTVTDTEVVLTFPEQK